MAKFKDSTGREWSLSLDAPTIAMVRKELDGLDLAGLDGGAYEKLVDDPCTLVNLMWLLVQDQAVTVGITDEQFGKSLVGDSIESATDALLEAITDFFPQRKRALLTAIASKNKLIRKIGMERAMERINDPALEEQVLAALDERFDEEIRSAMTRLSPATR